MEFKKLDEKAIKSFRIGKGILLAVMSIIALVIALIGVFAIESSFDWIFYSLAALIEFVFLAVFVIYPPVEYAQWKYAISDDRVLIEHGIIFLEKTVIPIIRIQNITVSQGPINRKLGLYDISIYTASGNFDIPCLRKETADEIADNLKDRIYIRISENERKGF